MPGAARPRRHLKGQRVIWRDIGTEWIKRWALAVGRVRFNQELMHGASVIYEEVRGISRSMAEPLAARDSLLKTLFFQPGTNSVNVPAWWYKETEIGVLCRVLELREKLGRDEELSGREVAILCGMGYSTFQHHRARQGLVPIGVGKARKGPMGSRFAAADVRTFEAFADWHYGGSDE